MDWNVFMEAHNGLPRQGPGSAETTRRAFSQLEGLPEHPRILDIGCGPGMQTRELARLSGGEIWALDNYPPFLEQLRGEAERERIAGSIRTVQGSMEQLEFPDSHFDAVWSEGAIYIMGFDRGLREWRRVLRSGGYLAVSELSWLTGNPPDEAERFWKAEYPAMRDVASNLAAIRSEGYIETGHFTLPASTWWEDYYTPLERRLPPLRERYAGNPEAIETLDIDQHEIDLFRKYSHAYGYVFYIMRNP